MYSDNYIIVSIRETVHWIFQTIIFEALEVSLEPDLYLDCFRPVKLSDLTTAIVF